MRKNKKNAAVMPSRGFSFSARASRYIMPAILTMAIIGLIAGIAIVNVMKDLAKSPLNIAINDKNGEIFKLLIDPMYLAIGVGGGIVLGFIFGLIWLAGHRSRAGASLKKTRMAKLKVQKDTAPIICESHAKVKSLGRGRIYFTGKTVEFYSNKYSKKPQKNVYISFDEIRSVTFKGTNKLYISTKYVTYKFKVPRGSAKYWAEELICY